MAAVVILLHILHPAIAARFGLAASSGGDDGGEVAVDEPRWTYFLGNTLFGLLDLAGLPRFGGSGSHWPLHRYSRMPSPSPSC